MTGGFSPPSTLAAVLAAGNNANALGITNLARLDFVAAAVNTGFITGSGYSLTGANATNMLDLAGTLNTSGAPVILKVAITDTASGAFKFVSFLAGAGGATEVFSIAKDGTTQVKLDASNFISVGYSALSVFRSGNNTASLDTTNFGGKPGLSLNNVNMVVWTSTAQAYDAADSGVGRTSAGLVEVNSGTLGTLRDLKARDLYTVNATYLLRTLVTLTTGAGAGLGTLTDAPAAGNPTKWLPIDDNGTKRHVPAW